MNYFNYPLKYNAKGDTDYSVHILSEASEWDGKAFCIF